MKVKLFTAQNMAAAMAQVKQELGREAVILHTRRFKKGGFLGFFGKEMVEIMAAIDTVAATVVEKKPQIVPTNAAGIDDARISALQLEMSSMRKMIEQMVGQVSENNKQTAPLLDILIKNDIDPIIAASLIKGLPDDITAGSEQGESRELLVDRIIGYLNKVEGINISPSCCKAIALIGPTGVGKTTTIAKLAANFALKEGYKVALITADTYRIAAVEQLKIYADIIGVPLDIVYSPDDLTSALGRHKDKHIVLIDTAGRSPSNYSQLSELQDLLAIEPHIETHLVLSATTKYRDALEIVNNFSVCSPQKILFTKIDEAANLGTILNLAYHFPTSLSYMTTGQSVPDDIELINSTKLANMILRD